MHLLGHDDRMRVRTGRLGKVRRRGRALFTASLMVSCLAGACIKRTYAIIPTFLEMDNAGAAVRALELTDPATNHEIEGYASAVSINRGESISFFVSTADPNYALQILRIGWYGGRGSMEMTPPVTVPGMIQAPPTVDAASGIIECDWQQPYVFHVPRSPDPAVWPSGIYVAKLTAQTSGKQSYITFVVRDDERRSDILFQSSVTTYQAYNEWGGRSLYTNPRSFKVSFNRPYLRGHGTGDMLYWEFSMVRYLEREGYDVSYTTDVDTHAHGEQLLLHKAFLSVGHDEYWSWQMRDNVEAAIQRGVNVGFFGSNVGYWQIRFEPSVITGDPDRTVVCYKNTWADPASHSNDPDERRRTTVKFRSHPVDRPEDALVGVMYDADPVQDDIVVSDASNWVFEGTGLRNGDSLHELLGYEVDRISEHSPAGMQRIAHSPYDFHGETRYADMTVYTASSGAIVFATGSMQWSWGLSDPELEGKFFDNPAVQRTTDNVLRRFIGAPVAPADQTITAEKNHQGRKSAGSTPTHTHARPHSHTQG